MAKEHPRLKLGRSAAFVKTRLKQWPQEKETWEQGYGHIEIGDQEGFGFVVRALNYGGLVFEDDKPATLAKALAGLEKGLAGWFKEQGIKVESPDHRQE